LLKLRSVLFSCIFVFKTLLIVIEKSCFGIEPIQIQFISTFSVHSWQKKEGNILRHLHDNHFTSSDITTYKYLFFPLNEEVFSSNNNKRTMKISMKKNWNVPSRIYFGDEMRVLCRRIVLLEGLWMKKYYDNDQHHHHHTVIATTRKKKLREEEWKLRMRIIRKSWMS
jgi:DNA polymerase sigma